MAFRLQHHFVDASQPTEPDASDPFGILLGGQDELPEQVDERIFDLDLRQLHYSPTQTIHLTYEPNARNVAPLGKVLTYEPNARNVAALGKVWLHPSDGDPVDLPYQQAMYATSGWPRSSIRKSRRRALSFRLKGTSAWRRPSIRSRNTRGPWLLSAGLPIRATTMRLGRRRPDRGDDTAPGTGSTTGHSRTIKLVATMMPCGTPRSYRREGPTRNRPPRPRPAAAPVARLPHQPRLHSRSARGKSRACAVPGRGSSRQVGRRRCVLSRYQGLGTTVSAWRNTPTISLGTREISSVRCPW